LVALIVLVASVSSEEEAPDSGEEVHGEAKGGATAFPIDVEIEIADRQRHPTIGLFEAHQGPLILQMEGASGMNRVVQTHEPLEGLAIEHEPVRVSCAEIPRLGSLVIGEKADASKFVVFHGLSEA
jgi:hypothetical protein